MGSRFDIPFEQAMTLTHPCSPEQLEAMQAATFPSFDQMFPYGGDWLGAMRRGLQWRARIHGEATFNFKRGDECTWGSGDMLALTARDCDELAKSVAEAAIRSWLSLQVSLARQAKGMQTWPGWHGDIGRPNLPNGYKVVCSHRKTDRIIPKSWHVVKADDKNKYLGEACDTEDEARLEAWRVALSTKTRAEAKQQESA